MKTLSDFSFSNRSSSRGKHDWASLLNGKVWSVESGVDFTSKPAIFLAQARMQAKKRGGKLRTQTQDDCVVIQFYRDEVLADETLDRSIAENPSALLNPSIDEDATEKLGVPKKPAKASRK